MSKFRTLFFDLDDTLYANNNGLWNAIRDRMNDYMLKMLHMEPDEISALRHHYYITYGTTLRGLQLHHSVSADDYLAYVHDLPLDQYIQLDPELRKMLDSLPQRKFVFTNADAGHAGRILSILGIQGCFEGIIDIYALEFHCKPEPEAYQIAADIAGESDPKGCLLLDDSPRNLAGARDFGFTTVLVGNHSTEHHIDYSISSLKELPLKLPELWSLRK
jgi:pyrimidine 5'-nucleotidase